MVVQRRASIQCSLEKSQKPPVTSSSVPWCLLGQLFLGRLVFSSWPPQLKEEQGRKKTGERSQNFDSGGSKADGHESLFLLLLLRRK